MSAAIEEVTTRSRSWNNESFGNIFKKKCNLQARIKGVQESPYYNSARGLQVLERKLLDELNEVLKQEEFFWFQKSRWSWVQDGNRNTTFYHKSTLIRHDQARVKFLKINGEWTSDHNTLVEHISNYFIGIFGRVETNVEVVYEAYGEPRILTQQGHSLIRQASVEKVRRAVFGMKKFGSPGPNGI